MPYVDVNDVRLFFTDEGVGPYTLVFLHGLSADSNDWNWSIPLLRGRYRVVAADLRGHGHSGTPATYSLRELADDVIGLVRHLGCGAVVPAGHSLGGAVAAVMAVEYPSEVAAVIEVDPAYALPEPLVQWWETGRQRWRSGHGNGEAETVPALPVTPDFLVTWNARRRQAMDPGVFWAIYEGLADGPQRIFQATSAADDYLRRRSCPVLSFHSLPGRVQWERALFQHPCSHALEWEGSSHFLHVERPRELAFVITSWLDRLAGYEPPPPVLQPRSGAETVNIHPS